MPRTTEQSFHSQAERPKQALITDIDNTFYRSDNPAAIAAAWRLREQATYDSYPIIAVTGNSYTVIQRRIDSGELPNFDTIVGSVGTEIWQQQSDTYIFDAAYDDRLKQTGYEHQHVTADADALLTSLNATMPDVSLQFQDASVNSVYKTSLYFFADNPTDLLIITQEFAHHFPKYKIVVSEEIHYNATLQPDDARKKYCLDIVPATKADAVNYLIDTMHLTKGIVAGDSGNDIDMLLDTPDSFVAVAVGGYKQELGDALVTATSDGDDIFRMKGNKPVFIDNDTIRKAGQTLLFIDDYLRRHNM